MHDLIIIGCKVLVNKEDAVMKKVYLDNAAATPVIPEVLEAMLPYLKEVYGNPQSLHDWGDEAREAVEDARTEMGALINAQAEEVIFTSSGTEANNFAIKGLAMAHQSKGKHIVISSIEHFSVMHSVRTLEKQGFGVTPMQSGDRYGMVDPQAVKQSLRKDTILVSIMYANSEAGTVQPIKEIAKLVKQAGVVFHTDAVAAAGSIPVNVRELEIDALPDKIGANQFYGPKGVGALWLKKGVRIISMRLPNNASFCIEFIEGEAMLMLLSHQGIAASSGSAPISIGGAQGITCPYRHGHTSGDCPGLASFQSGGRK